MSKCRYRARHYGHNFFFIIISLLFFAKWQSQRKLFNKKKKKMRNKTNNNLNVGGILCASLKFTGAAFIKHEKRFIRSKSFSVHFFFVFEILIVIGVLCARLYSRVLWYGIVFYHFTYSAFGALCDATQNVCLAAICLLAADPLASYSHSRVADHF